MTTMNCSAAKCGRAGTMADEALGVYCLLHAIGRPNCRVLDERVGEAQQKELKRILFKVWDGLVDELEDDFEAKRRLQSASSSSGFNPLTRSVPLVNVGASSSGGGGVKRVHFLAPSANEEENDAKRAREIGSSERTRDVDGEDEDDGGPMTVETTRRIKSSIEERISRTQTTTSFPDVRRTGIFVLAKAIASRGNARVDDASSSSSDTFLDEAFRLESQLWNDAGGGGQGSTNGDTGVTTATYREAIRTTVLSLSAAARAAAAAESAGRKSSSSSSSDGTALLLPSNPLETLVEGVYTCPSCAYKTVKSLRVRWDVSSGKSDTWGSSDRADHVTKFTCVRCGTSWTKEI